MKALSIIGLTFLVVSILAPGPQAGTLSTGAIHPEFSSLATDPALAPATAPAPDAGSSTPQASWSAPVSGKPSAPPARSGCYDPGTASIHLTGFAHSITVSVFDVRGVMRHYEGNAGHEVAVGNLPHGTYLVNVVGAGQSVHGFLFSK